MDKFFITGFSGFVSRHFLNLLDSLDENASVLGVDLQNPFFDISKFKKIKCNFVKMDLLDKENVKKILYEFQPNYIIHFASYSSVAFSWKNPILSFQNNTNISLNILDAIRIDNIPARILSIGSSEEYGNVDKKDIPLKETQQLKPLSPYAVARVSQEMLSQVFTASYGLDIVMTRSFNHIGPWQSDLFVVPSFARQLVEGWQKKEKKIKLNTGDLSIVRDFLDVRDVVKAYYALLKQGRKGEIYNICSGRGITLNEILQIMAKYLDIEFESTVDSRLVRPNENMVVIGSNEKIKNDTGWRQEIQLEQAVADILQDWKERLKV